MIISDRPDYVIYQSNNNEPAEEAILVKKFDDVVELTQGKDNILVNHGTIKELVKVLNVVYRNQGKTK